MTGGLPADTPAVAVAGATRPDEKIVAGTVADIGAKLAEFQATGPVLVFIGRAFREAVPALSTLASEGRHASVIASEAKQSSTVP